MADSSAEVAGAGTTADELRSPHAVVHTGHTRDRSLEHREKFRGDKPSETMRSSTNKISTTYQQVIVLVVGFAEACEQTAAGSGGP